MIWNDKNVNTFPLISAIRQGHLFSLLFFFFNFWLCWIFVASQGLSLVAPSRGYSFCCGEQASHCRGFSFEEHRPRHGGFSSCSTRAQELRHTSLAARGMQNLPGPGMEAVPRHWQADSHPLCHRGSPCSHYFSQRLSGDSSHCT